MATPPDTFSLETLSKMLADFKEPAQPSFLLSPGYRDKVAATFQIEGSKDRSSNPLRAVYTTEYASIPMEVYDIPKQKVYDWSACRSPSRAKRRHAKGIPQRVKITEHDVAYMFDKRCLQFMDQRYDDMVVKLLHGGQ